MGLIFDSFWRALAYLWMPRVIALSLMPLVLMMVGSLVLGYFFWDSAVAWIQQGLQSFAVAQTIIAWTESIGWSGLTAAFGPLAVLLIASPLVVISSLLLVSAFMTPVMVKLVHQRRFSGLSVAQPASFWKSAWWSTSSTLLAVVALLVSMPLWLVPPMALLLPPLIWGWLTYRVFAYEALAEAANREERDALFLRHRNTFWLMGVVSGYLGAAPSLLWASGAMFIALAPVLVPLAVWVYTLVFAFSSLWFAHFGLSALHRMRLERTSGTGAGNASVRLDAVRTVTDVEDISR